MSDTQRTDYTLSEAQMLAWRIAENHGFHEVDRSRAKVLALIHSEVSEALEADRDPELDDADYAEELADIVIRVLDHSEECGIDLWDFIRLKMEKNRERDEKHGKNY